MTINGTDANRLYHKLANELMYRCDEIVQPRGMEIKELRNVELYLSNPRARIITLPDRNIDMRYLIGELCFYLRGSNALDEISFYSSFWNKLSDDQCTVNSAYGKRLFYDGTIKAQSQIGYVVDELKKDKDSRKGVATIYDGVNDARPSLDNPCTMYLDFYIRRDFLCLTTHMRSNDVWLGLPYDLPFFCLVQEIVYLQLRQHYPKLRLGHYSHIVDSMHVYSKNYNAFKKIAKTLPTYDEKSTMPALQNKDIYTWFKDILWIEKEYRNGRLPCYNLCSDFLTSFQLWAYYNLIH